MKIYICDEPKRIKPMKKRKNFAAKATKNQRVKRYARQMKREGVSVY